MQLKVGQSDRETAKAGTYGGVLVTMLLVGAANDYSIVPSDFNLNLVQVLTTLKRNGQVWPLQANNLNILGTYNMYNNNYDVFLNGQVIIPDAGGTPMTLLRTAYLKFRSPVTLNNGDVLDCQIQFGSGSLSTNINTANSFLDFILSPTIGYEQGIPQTKVDVVNTNASNQDFVNDNYVKHIKFLNFDQTSWVNPVLSNVSVMSDKLNYQTSLYETIGADNIKWPNNVPYQYGATQLAPTVRRTLNISPQIITLFEAGMGNNCLNNCRASLSFVSANVNASQNWVVWDTLYVDRSNLQKSLNRLAKHSQENAAKLVTGTGA